MARSKDFIYISPCKPPLGQLRFCFFFSHPNRVIYCLWNKYHQPANIRPVWYSLLYMYLLFTVAHTDLELRSSRGEVEVEVVCPAGFSSFCEFFFFFTLYKGVGGTLRAPPGPSHRSASDLRLLNSLQSDPS